MNVAIPPPPPPWCLFLPCHCAAVRCRGQFLCLVFVNCFFNFQPKPKISLWLYSKQTKTKKINCWKEDLISLWLVCLKKRRWVRKERESLPSKVQIAMELCGSTELLFWVKASQMLSQSHQRCFSLLLQPLILLAEHSTDWRYWYNIGCSEGIFSLSVWRIFAA